MSLVGGDHGPGVIEGVVTGASDHLDSGWVLDITWVMGNVMENSTGELLSGLQESLHSGYHVVDVLGVNKGLIPLDIENVLKARWQLLAQMRDSLCAIPARDISVEDALATNGWVLYLFTNGWAVC